MNDESNQFSLSPLQEDLQRRQTNGEEHNTDDVNTHYPTLHIGRVVQKSRGQNNSQEAHWYVHIKTQGQPYISVSQPLRTGPTVGATTTPML
jgi:hypothetical protein